MMMDAAAAAAGGGGGGVRRVRASMERVNVRGSGPDSAAVSTNVSPLVADLNELMTIPLVNEDDHHESGGNHELLYQLGVDGGDFGGKNATSTRKSCGGAKYDEEDEDGHGKEEEEDDEEEEGGDIDMETAEMLNQYQCRLHMHERIHEMARLKKYSYRKLISKLETTIRSRNGGKKVGGMQPLSRHVFVDGYWLERLLHAFSGCEDWAMLLQCSRSYQKQQRQQQQPPQTPQQPQPQHNSNNSNNNPPTIGRGGANRIGTAGGGGIVSQSSRPRTSGTSSSGSNPRNHPNTTGTVRTGGGGMLRPIATAAKGIRSNSSKNNNNTSNNSSKTPSMSRPRSAGK